MTTIAQFLESRIAEDEAVARGIAACESHDPEGQGYEGTVMEAVDHKRHGVITVDPTRVLAECAAKRAIIAQYAAECSEKSYTREDADRSAGAEVALELALYALAAVFKDHPDYRQEWAIG